MKIAITGGAGFIGSHVADALIECGHDVHILDDLSTGRRENVPAKAVLHVLDIRSGPAAALLRDQSFDVLVHHAAQMDVRRSVADPNYDADVNVQGFLNLMEAARRTTLRKVLFASTGGAIYGEPVYAPQDEKHPLRPISPYGITKLATEKYLHFYRRQYGIESVTLRYANVYGPRQNAHGDAGVVAIFAQRMLNDAQPIINGSGTQTRDYVYVDDVVRANLLALDYEGSGVFNIGTAQETSVNDLFDLIRAAANSETERRHGPAKPGEQQRSVLSFDRALRELEWSPRMDVQAGLSRTVDWFRSPFEAAADAPIPSVR